MKIKADKESIEVIDKLVDFALKAGGKLALPYVAGLINAGIELIEDVVDVIEGEE